jgi:septal ring factor EnvC (AmiA/AmiB activator)
MESARLLTNARLTILGLAAGVYALAANQAIVHSAFGNTPAISTQQSTIQQRLQELEREARQLDAQQRTVLNELRALQLDREMKVAELEARTVALAEAAGAIAALEAQQTSLAETIARQQPIVRARAVELYKRGRASDLRRIVDAASARDAMRAWRQMAAASSRDAARFAEHRASIAKLAAARADLDAQRAEAERLRTGADAARAALDRSIRAHERRIDAIAKERGLNDALAAELKNAAAGLAATVEKLPSNPSNPANPSNPSAAPITAFKRALPWPAAGKVVRAFRASAPGALPFNGIEIAVQDDAPVSAVHEGEVAFSGPFTGFGHLIIVQHGAETFTLYGHLSAGHVGKGDRVTAGQVIGRAGRPPAGRDSRLYFELRVDGVPVNPLQWFRQQ